MNFHKITKNNFWGDLARYSCLVLTTVSMMLVATTANAACGNPAGTAVSAAPNLLSLATIAAAPSNNSIVGLWHVTYTTEGQLFYEAFDMWHSDGTELETANLSPIEGNFCMGVWKQVGSTVHLNHTGWGFDNGGNPIGLFTLTEKNVLTGNGNSYRGTFDYKQYDLNGSVSVQVTGTLAATRISAN